MTTQRTRKPGRGQTATSKPRQKAPATLAKPPKPEREPGLLERVKAAEEKKTRFFEEAEREGNRLKSQAMVDAIQRLGWDKKEAMLGLDVAEASMLRGRDHKGCTSRMDIWTPGDAIVASLTGDKKLPRDESLAKTTLLQVHSELRALAAALWHHRVGETAIVDLSDIAHALHGIAGRAKAAADFSRTYAHANREVTP